MATQLLAPVPLPCWICGGDGELWYSWIDPVKPCRECEGTGEESCCVCGARPAVTEHHWTSKDGPRTDPLCVTCRELPVYREEVGS